MSTCRICCCKRWLPICHSWTEFFGNTIDIFNGVQDLFRVCCKTPLVLSLLWAFVRRLPIMSHNGHLSLCEHYLLLIFLNHPSLSPYPIPMLTILEETLTRNSQDNPTLWRVTQPIMWGLVIYDRLWARLPAPEDRRCDWLSDATKPTSFQDVSKMVWLLMEGHSCKIGNTPDLKG